MTGTIPRASLLDAVRSLLPDVDPRDVTNIWIERSQVVVEKFVRVEGERVNWERETVTFEIV